MQSIAHVLPWLTGKLIDEAPAAFAKYAAEAEVSELTVKNRLAWCRAALRYAYKIHKIGSMDIIERLPVPNVDRPRLA